jgi:hypothetical protein
LANWEDEQERRKGNPDTDINKIAIPTRYRLRRRKFVTIDT